MTKLDFYKTNLPYLADFIRYTENELLYHLFKNYQLSGFFNKGYWYYFPGKGNIILVAHIDTVRHEVDPLIKIDMKKGLIYLDEKDPTSCSLGADDRVGVYLGVKLHKELNVPLLLFDHEETGGLGVKNFCEWVKNENKYSELIKDKIFIEMDRRGDKNFVDYWGISNRKIWDFFERNGFRKEEGSFSDVYVLQQHFSVDAINISIGFNHEHTRMEYFDFNSWWNTYKVLRKFIEEWRF